MWINGPTNGPLNMRGVLIIVDRLMSNRSEKVLNSPESQFYCAVESFHIIPKHASTRNAYARKNLKGKGIVRLLFFSLVYYFFINELDLFLSRKFISLRDFYSE